MSSYSNLASEAVLHELLDGSTTGILTGTEAYASAQFGRQAFAFNGATRIDLPEVIEIAGTASLFFRVRTDALAAGIANVMGYRNGSDISALAYRADLNPDAWRTTRPIQGSHSLTFNGTGTTIDATWRSICWISTLTASTVYQDGVQVGGLSGMTSGGTWKFRSIGGIDSTLAFVGEIADVMILARAVTVDETLVYMAGPPPTPGPTSYSATYPPLYRSPYRSPYCSPYRS